MQNVMRSNRGLISGILPEYQKEGREPLLLYRGRKEDYGSKRQVLADFWFCADDIERCVKGTKRKWIIDWSPLLEVWPVLSGTDLSREKTLLLQHAGFRL